MLTTPTEIEPRHIELANSINPEASLQFVSVDVAPEAKLNQCYFNVFDHIKVHGGTPVFGWCFWEAPMLWFEAEHHCVWQSTDGSTLDISPKPDGETQILFVRDDDAAFCPANPKWRSSIRVPIDRSEQMKCWLQAKDRVSIFEIAHSRANGRERETRIEGNWVSVYETLQYEEKVATVNLQHYLKDR